MKLKCLLEIYQDGNTFQDKRKMKTPNPKTKGGKMKTANELIVEMNELLWDKRAHIYSNHNPTSSRLCNLACDIMNYLDENGLR